MLAGVYGLIVEDEFLIALEIQRVLEEAGARPPAIVRTAEEAQTLAGAERFDLALVAAGADIGETRRLVEALRGSGLAVVVLSPDGAHRGGIAGLEGIGIVGLPFKDGELAAAAIAALEARKSQPQR